MAEWGLAINRLISGRCNPVGSHFAICQLFTESRACRCAVFEQDMMEARVFVSPGGPRIPWLFSKEMTYCRKPCFDFIPRWCGAKTEDAALLLELGCQDSAECSRGKQSL